MHREYEREQKRAGVSGEEDMVFGGGLRIPGSIWHRLYRYMCRFTSIHVYMSNSTCQGGDLDKNCLVMMSL